MVLHEASHRARGPRPGRPSPADVDRLLASSRVRLVDLNALVRAVLDRLEDGAALPGPCRPRLDAGLPAVLGDPEMLGWAVADLVRHAERVAGRRGGVMLVQTERVASVVRGESVARIRVEVQGTEGPPETSPAPDFSRAAWIAAGHGGALAHNGAPAATTLDVPGLGAGWPASASPEAGA